MVECAHGSTVGVPRCEHTVIVLSLKANVCVHVELGALLHGGIFSVYLSRKTISENKEGRSKTVR